MSSKLYYRMCHPTQVAPSGECLQGNGFVQLIAAT